MRKLGFLSRALRSLTQRPCAPRAGAPAAAGAAWFEPLEGRVLLAGDPAGNAPAVAQNLGLLQDAPVSVTERVGGGDRRDFYRFRVEGLTGIQLALGGLADNADIALARDDNRNGVVDPWEVLATGQNAGTADESLTATVDAGVYLIRVSPAAGALATDYTLTVTPDALDSPAGVRDVYEADDAARLARPISTQGLPQTRSLHVLHDVDWVRFRVTRTSNVVIQAASALGELDLRMYRGGEFGAPVAVAESGAGHDEARVVARLEPGVYFVRVAELGGDARVDRYTLFVDATPIVTPITPPQGVAAVQPLGLLLGRQVVRGELGVDARDFADTFTFFVEETTLVRARLSVDQGTGGEARLTILDANGLAVLPVNVFSSTTPGQSGEAAFVLSPGAYVLRISTTPTLTGQDSLFNPGSGLFVRFNGSGVRIDTRFGGGLSTGLFDDPFDPRPRPFALGTGVTAYMAQLVALPVRLLSAVDPFDQPL